MITMERFCNSNMAILCVLSNNSVIGLMWWYTKSFVIILIPFNLFYLFWQFLICNLLHFFISFTFILHVCPYNFYVINYVISNFINFNKCLKQWNHQQNKGNEHIHHPKCFFIFFFIIPLPCFLFLCLPWPFSSNFQIFRWHLIHALPYFDSFIFFYVNEVSRSILHWLVSFITLIWQLPHVIMYIGFIPFVALSSNNNLFINHGSMDSWIASVCLLLCIFLHNPSYRHLILFLLCNCLGKMTRS